MTNFDWLQTCGFCNMTSRKGHITCPGCGKKLKPKSSRISDLYRNAFSLFRGWLKAKNEEIEILRKSALPSQEKIGLEDARRKKHSFSYEELSKRIHARYKILDNGCWEWQKAMRYNKNGLPIIYVMYLKKGIFVRKFLFLEKRNVAKSPKNKIVANTCGNFKCVNPDHADFRDKNAHLRENLAIARKNKSIK